VCVCVCLCCGEGSKHDLVWHGGEVFACVCVCIYMFVRMYLYMCVCVCVCVCVVLLHNQRAKVQEELCKLKKESARMGGQGG
jgi:hypothetical protein